MSFLPLAAASFQLSPVLILIVGIAAVILAVTVMRIHPFFALLLSAMLVGILASELPGDDKTSHWLNAVEMPMVEMGKTAGTIAFVIAMAAVIGICLTASGAADKIVLRLVAVLGEGRAALALMLSGFILSIPVFFDTMFFLLIPLARSLAHRVGKHYVLFVMAICGGGVITHSVVPPTPGPVGMADNLDLDLGVAIWVGTVVGIVPALGSMLVAKWIDMKNPLSVETSAAGDKELFSEEGLPPFGLALLPVVLPVLLIGAASVVEMLFRVEIEANGDLPVYCDILRFLGNKNIGLLIGTLLAVYLVIRRIGCDRKRIEEMVGEAMHMAGVIILITSAGGAFGAMIGHSGIGKTIEGLGQSGTIHFVILAWAVAAVFKIAQGSGTVSMLTTSAIMANSLPDTLEFHRIYIYLAIGFGSIFGSWMNDSGFWVVGRMSGFTEQQTLRTWTVLLAAIGVMGLVLTWILAMVLPFG